MATEALAGRVIRAADTVADQAPWGALKWIANAQKIPGVEQQAPFHAQ